LSILAASGRRPHVDICLSVLAIGPGRTGGMAQEEQLFIIAMQTTLL